MAKAPKTTTAPTGQIAPFGLRMLPELREKIEAAARESGRSMNAEVVSRLQQSFEARQDPYWQLRVAVHTNEANQKLIHEHMALLDTHIAKLTALVSNPLPNSVHEKELEQLSAELEKSRSEQAKLFDRRIALWKERVDINDAREIADRENVELLDKIADASMQSDLLAMHDLEERMGIPTGSRRSVTLSTEAGQKRHLDVQEAIDRPREPEKPSLEETKVVAGDVQVGLLDLIKLAFSAGRESQENGTATKDLMKLLAIKSPKK